MGTLLALDRELRHIDAMAMSFLIFLSADELYLLDDEKFFNDAS